MPSGRSELTYASMLRAAAVICSLLVLAPACTTDKAGTNYQTLVAAAKQGSQPIDWQALRFAYAETADFDPFEGRSGAAAAARKKMWEALGTGDFSGAAQEAEQRLDQVYVDIDAHFVGYLAYQKLGDAARAKVHHDAVVGLVRSIRTGDGRTPATAFTVITVGEEYTVLRILEVKPTLQQLIVDKETGHAYDRLDVVDRDGDAQSLYFLIDRVLAGESAALKAKR
jgi:Domain of unknown function (DUF4919)